MRCLRSIIWLWLGVAACRAQVENRVDLGDGYDAAIVAKESTSSFESIGYWEYLRYKGKELCSLGRYALSPDKNCIAFQEASSGKVFLIDKKTHMKAELVSEFPGRVVAFDWKAKPRFLVMEFSDKEPLIWPLPPSSRFSPNADLLGKTAQLDIIASISGFQANQATTGVGVNEKRFDILDVDIQSPAELKGQDMELMLSRDPANASYKDKIRYFVHLSVSVEDFEVNRRYGLFLLVQAPLKPFKDPNHPSEPSALHLTDKNLN